ncbi:FCD domain protein [compost metagenome]
MQQQDMLRILQCDLEFHGYLYERCDNQMALDIWNRMKMKMMHFMSISVRVNTTDQLVEEHLSLLEILKSGDLKTAEKRFKQHMRGYKLFSV